MFSLSTELPFGQPEAPRELHAAFAEFKEAVHHWLADVTQRPWPRSPGALHGIATLTRTRLLRPDYQQARLTMLAGQLAGTAG